MKYSKLFGKTVKTVSKDIQLDSHKLLVQAGFIRESTAGRYFMLPLGMRVQQKIVGIVREEMNKTGAQEMITPVLHPLELWKETNRTTSAGFELMKIEDRRGAEFALGGTAEEMFVDVVRRFPLSYKDLPFNVYQFSQKFRDELRARGGLLRVREFMMKDAYSFDVNEEEFKKEYRNMWEAYDLIFKRMGLETVVVESDNGYIGGDYCHEFVVLSDIGESKFLETEDGTYHAHEEVAVFARDSKNIDEEIKELQEVDAQRGNTMEDGVKLHNLPLWQQIKDVLYVDEKGRFILAVIRGDYDVNEIKLKHLVGAYTLRFATDEEIREKLHSEPGFISPVGIKDNLEQGVELIVVGDESLRTVCNMYGGSNKQFKDYVNVNIERDYKVDAEGDIALAKGGYTSKDGKQKLVEKRGIEVGNIFQLGYHYSKLMNATFTAVDGTQQYYYMGCYGIGIGRTMQTVVEVSHDDRGIIWPENLSPFKVHLVGLDIKDGNALSAQVYQQLLDAGIDVLYDDREDVNPGAKFADADLIGIPVRLVVSPPYRRESGVEKPDRKRNGIAEC